TVQLLASGPQVRESVGLAPFDFAQGAPSEVEGRTCGLADLRTSLQFLVATCATVYERGGSLKVIRLPAAGGSSRRGLTRRGSANVFTAFRSGPVSVSHASTRVGTTSC